MLITMEPAQGHIGMEAKGGLNIGADSDIDSAHVWGAVMSAHVVAIGNVRAHTCEIVGIAPQAIDAAAARHGTVATVMSKAHRKDE